jgi:predicted dehydrogenase
MGNSRKLGVGFVGSGFITRFHIQSWSAVRDADILGVWSPNRDNAESTAALARSLNVGDAQAYGSITEMIADPNIDCLWLCGPNHRRIENMEEIVHALKSGKGELVGIACEEPLGRNVAEARRVVELVEEAEILHGYLENQ